MPQLGETVVEGTITKWLKGPGDQVDRDEPLFEISTDKVDTEVPSPVAGTLKDILVQEGETVKVGTELATIDEDGGAVAEEKGGEAEAGEPEEAHTAESESAEQQEKAAAEEERAAEAQQPQRERAEAPPRQEAPARPEPAPPRREERRPVSAPADRGPRTHILSPLVRRLAEENNIDLSQVEGSGTGGRITKKDIMSFMESGGAQRPALRAVPEEGPAPARATQIPAGEAEQTVKISHIRKRIAENMVASLQTSARAWNLVEVNMENIVRLRSRAKDRFKAEEGINLTYMPFVARAVCDALVAFPDVNAKLDLEAGTATYRRYVNLGVAVAYEDGLIVPVVHGAEEMNLVGLARAINDVGTRARAKKLKPDEVHGGTFTVTNPGPFGSIISVPIMNPGETAILAFDAIEKRPVVIDDAIAIRHMVYLSLSWDHRMIDGATAAQFLGRLKQNLEDWDFTPELQAYLEE
jgi:2-oxoglutarate dehydrogenase E2 component (dihydrolipoamide succinyltransferase)